MAELISSQHFNTDGILLQVFSPQNESYQDIYHKPQCFLPEKNDAAACSICTGRRANPCWFCHTHFPENSTPANTISSAVLVDLSNVLGDFVDLFNIITKTENEFYCNFSYKATI